MHEMYQSARTVSRPALRPRSRRPLLGIGLAILVVIAASAFFMGYKNAGAQKTTTKPPASVKTASTQTTNSNNAQVTMSAALNGDNYCQGNPGNGKLIVVSIGLQHLWACDGTTVVNQSAVTTGTTVITNGVNDNTPIGTWQIYSKQTDTYLKGCDANGCWNDYVQYWMPFDGEVGFHDASWQKFPFGSSDYHTDGSHACVHLPTAMAAWIYNWAPIGTTVTISA